MYNALLGPRIILDKEPNEMFQNKINNLVTDLNSVSEKKVDLEMGTIFYKLDDITGEHFYSELSELQKNVNQFLHDYQYIIVSKMDTLNKHYAKQTYLSNKKILQKQREIWFAEARQFVVENRQEMLPKLLKVYSFLDCQFSKSFSMKKLEKYQFLETQKPWVFRNTFNGKTCTLEELLTHLWTYEIGIYNDTEDTRHWGLFKSSFYNLVLFRILEKTIDEIVNNVNTE
jgi:hypothetical protein